MRIAPTLIPHLDRGGPDIWVDAVLGTAVTHNDPAAIASSVAFVGMLAELLTMEAAPAVGWWVESFVRRARPIEGNDTRYQPGAVSSPENGLDRFGSLLNSMFRPLLTCRQLRRPQPGIPVPFCWRLFPLSCTCWPGTRRTRRKR